MKAIEAASSALQSSIKLNLEPSLARAARKATSKAKKICIEYSSGEIAPATWRAICKRNGTFKNTKRINYDWNEAFAEIYLQPLALAWSRVLSSAMTNIHKAYLATIIASLRIFSYSLAASIAGPSFKAMKGILGQLPSLEDQIKGKVTQSQRNGQTRGREIHTSIKGLIMKHMLPVYRSCALQVGERLTFCPNTEVFHYQ